MRVCAAAFFVTATTSSSDKPFAAAAPATLYKKKIPCQIVDLLITNCNSDGVSKKGQWKIYQEEISLKTDLSSVYLAPLFYILSIIKYSLRKIINVL